MQDEWDVRQAELLVEKLTRTRCQDSYLPMSQDKLLSPCWRRCAATLPTRAPLPSGPSSCTAPSAP